jgi:hypothetical protein
MSTDLMNNPKLANWCNAKGQMFIYNTAIDGAAGNNKIVRDVGCPFLLINVAELALRSGADCSQLVPNVEYPNPIVMKIKFTVRAQASSASGVLTAANYYPHVYKFYPYIYEQKPGHSMSTPTRLQARYSDAADVINNANWHDSGAVDLTMIGNGWFDDLKDYAQRNAASIGRNIIKAVRLGEQFTRDSANETVQKINHGLKTVSDVAKHYGYGSRASAVRR